MKPLIWIPSTCALYLLLSGCANQDPLLANDPLGTGPFDSQGRYREEWADDPTKWRKPGNRNQTPDDLPVIASNDQPPANANPLAPQGTPRPTASPVVTRPAPSPQPVLVKPKPKPTVVSKPKPKPVVKPKTVRYVVKKGDTLSAIASRHGSSVSAIQKANGISGSLIHPGKSLVIPKR
jgi:LysM repeat protein